MDLPETQVPEPQNWIVGLEWRSPENLVANPVNFRLHSTEQWEVMLASLRENGWVQALIENRRTGYLLDGHLRAQLAFEMGIESVPVLVIDVDPELEPKILVSLDPIAAMAGTERSVLETVLESVQTESPAMQAMMNELLAQATLVVVPEDKEAEDKERRQQAHVVLTRARWLLKRMERQAGRDGTDDAERGRLERAAELMREVITILKGVDE